MDNRFYCLYLFYIKFEMYMHMNKNIVIEENRIFLNMFSSDNTV